MLTQLVNPGTPVLYGCISSITDLRDMKYLSGAVEMGLMNAAAAQMARFYDLPLYSTAGMSDSKINDGQSAYESAITGLMVALAGGNCIHDAAGFLEFCMTASFDKLVIDNEIIGMIMRAVEGIKVDDTSLAFEVLKKAGPGGHFVSSRHTRRYMRTEQFHPKLSDRDNRDRWENEGGKDTNARASEKVREILEGPAQSVLPSEIREHLKSEIPGLRSFLME
jgi:trimethylamine--corrinoid protein Co-methyltransferase